MIKGEKVILREKRLSDARDDHAWELDAELAALDAAEPLDISFSQYLREYSALLHNPMPTSRRFAIDTTDGKHIGNCSYYNISLARGEAELGIMIGDRNYWSKGYGTDIITSLLKHIFNQPNFNRIYLKTLESNKRAQKCFRKCGFVSFGHLSQDGYKFLLMDINRKQWEKRQNSSH